MRVTFNNALRGDAKALAAFIQLVRPTGLMDEEPELSSAESISAEDEAILAEFLERHGLTPQRRSPPAEAESSPHKTAKKKEPEDKT